MAEKGLETDISQDDACSGCINLLAKGYNSESGVPRLDGGFQTSKVLLAS